MEIMVELNIKFYNLAKRIKEAKTYYYINQ